MKKVTIILFLFPQLFFGQNNSDSKLKLYNNYRIIDTLKCRLLIDLIDAENDNTLSAKYNLILEKHIKTLKENKVDEKLIKQYEVIFLSNKGYFELFNSNYIEALNYYFKALPIAEKNKDYESLCSINNSIGSIFSDLNEVEKSINYYNKVVAIALKHNFLKKLGTAYNNLGYTYLNQNKVDLGFNFYQKSLKIRNKLNDSLAIMQTIANIGGVYARKNNQKKAIELYKSCYKYELSNNDATGAFSSALNISTAYFKSGKFVLAEKFAEKSLSLAKSENYYFGIFNACERLERIYEKRNKLSKIIEVLKLKDNAKDSLEESESKEFIYKKEFKYESEKKESQIVALSQAKKITDLENQRQKSILLVSVFWVSSSCNFSNSFCFLDLYLLNNK